MTAALVGGFAATYSLDLPARVNAITGWIPFFIALSLVEPPRTRMENRHWENTKFIFRSLFGHSRLLTLLILNFILYGFATFAAVWALQAYWKSERIPILYFGYAWALVNLLVALVARSAHFWERLFGSSTIVVLIGLLPIFGYFGMSHWGLWAGAAFSLCFPICRGLNSVVLQDAINSRVPSSMRATANSTASLGGRSLFVFFAPWIGHSLDHQGFHLTFLRMAGIFLIIFLFVCLPLLSERHHFKPVESN
jgi:hypothetical protein